MAISELSVDIKCKKRPWFHPAFCACYVLCRARIVSRRAATNFLVDRCMTVRAEPSTSKAVS